MAVTNYSDMRCSEPEGRGGGRRDIMGRKKQKVVIKATVRIITEGFLDLFTHAVSWALGHQITLRLVSLETDAGSKKPLKSPKVPLRLSGGSTKGSDSFITVCFHVDEGFGTPGAVTVKSRRGNEFYLKSVTLSLPDSTQIYFPCYSWIVHRRLDIRRECRVFFSNQVYLPSETPPALLNLRQDELVSLRGDGKGKRRHGQRIYDYALYNDLGNPDVSKDLVRPVLGGSAEYPYPRRCRTGRRHAKAAPACEMPKTDFDSVYVPRDERFSALKKRQFMAVGLKSLGRSLLSAVVSALCDDSPFDKLDDIDSLYVRLDKLLSAEQDFSDAIKYPPPIDGTTTAFPPPALILVNKEAWKSDREFARQRLAGTNPVVIRRLEIFPPMSALDRETYGEPKSSITFEQLEPHLEKLTVEEALKQKRLFILDYHDVLMPYLDMINKTCSKTYASRTIFFLSECNMLLPVAIELTLPPKQKGANALSKVFTPSDPRLAKPDWLWQFAKTHVAIIDGGYHQLVSHWMRTHACVEPIIIATRRNLSSLHPLHVLLSPHFKDTMHINAMARASLICAGGRIESHFFSAKYSMEISSKAYTSWRFDEQSLPRDLLKRGMAEKDPTAKHGLRLAIEDYPFAADGLDLWAALETWVRDYVALYYDDDVAVQHDVEVQGWWREVREVGHADHADAAWWPQMRTVEELVESVTIIIWLASALHAAVNFGQYAYCGYMPNSPCMARRLIPEEGTPEYKDMMANPEKFFLHMVPARGPTIVAMAVLEILSQHISEEEYLGQRKDDRWTADPRALAAFERFRQSLADVEAQVQARNAASSTLHHRAGPVLLPYTLLAPSPAGSGLTLRGVPNSISI